MIGIMADRCRGSDTLPTVYSNSSPTLLAEASDRTLAVASIGVEGQKSSPPLAGDVHCAA